MFIWVIGQWSVIGLRSCILVRLIGSWIGVVSHVSGTLDAHGNLAKSRISDKCHQKWLFENGVLNKAYLCSARYATIADDRYRMRSSTKSTVYISHEVPFCLGSLKLRLDRFPPTFFFLLQRQSFNDIAICCLCFLPVLCSVAGSGL